MNLERLKDKSRTQQLAYERFLYMAYLRDQGVHTVDIAKELNRDRTTVILGLQRYEMIKDTKEFMYVVSELANVLGIKLPTNMKPGDKFFGSVGQDKWSADVFVRYVGPGDAEGRSGRIYKKYKL